MSIRTETEEGRKVAARVHERIDGYGLRTEDQIRDACEAEGLAMDADAIGKIALLHHETWTRLRRERQHADATHVEVEYGVCVAIRRAVLRLERGLL